MMKVWTSILVIAAVGLGGCGKPYTPNATICMEVQLDNGDQHFNNLNIQAAIEKIVGDAGLCPYNGHTPIIDPSNPSKLILSPVPTNVSTWIHPDYPQLSLSIFRQNEKFLLQLNLADTIPNTVTKNLHKQLEKQLAALPAELIPCETQE